MNEDIVQRLKDAIVKNYGVKIVDGIIPSSFEFDVDIVRKPKIKISGSPTGLFNIAVEAERSGTRQLVYSGSNMNSDDIMYMLRVEIDYFRKLKK